MTYSLNRIRAILKLVLFFVLLICSICALYIRLVFTRKRDHRKTKFQARKIFCRRANFIFGIRILLVGNPPPNDTYLYISNHRSFYDPVAFLSQLIANPVSKAEVSRYPLIGWGARLTEVLMLDRSKRLERGRMKTKIYENLRDETSILLYPEGTTTAEEWTGTFKKGAFEATIQAGRKIIPIAMEYPNEMHYWINQPLFDQFVKQVVTRSDPRIYISIGEPVWDEDPQRLLSTVQNSIDEQIFRLRQIREKDRRKGTQREYYNKTQAEELPEKPT